MTPGDTLRIEQIEIMPLDTLPSLRRVISTGPIAYGKDNLVGRSVLIAVRAGGLTGYGQMRPVNPFQGETAASVVATLRDFYAPAAIGRDPWHRAALMGDCNRMLPRNSAALAILDMAVHDLLGKAMGLPVHALLGGACKETIPLEWSVGLAPLDTMRDEAIAAVERFQVPYTCFKVGPAERMTQDIDTIREIHKVLGGRTQMALDANNSLRDHEAIRLANALEDTDLAYFEQPVAQGDVAGMRRVRDAVATPIMADEAVYAPEDATRVLNAEAADVLCIKLYKCGGLWRGRQIALVAEAAHRDVNCAGTANGSHLEALAAAHLCAATPNHAFGAEFIMGLPEVAEDPIAPGPVIPVENGHCPIPMGPGLGVEIDTKAVDKHAIERIIVKS